MQLWQHKVTLLRGQNSSRRWCGKGMGEDEQTGPLNASLKGRVRITYIQVLLAAALSLKQKRFAVWSGVTG